MTMSSAMKFQLDGFVGAHPPNVNAPGLEGRFWRLAGHVVTPAILQAFVYLVSFGTVMFIALLNPQNLIKVHGSNFSCACVSWKLS
eukprot:m.847699 g.847699  ORF g.847699 m.847699 type:complete len:86 (+) comp59565_c0_seq4:206-463(+)